tara:strand:- start:290 stop:637 length:348 start_codon:yes stop_codon:yes gene_type:complete
MTETTNMKSVEVEVNSVPDFYEARGFGEETMEQVTRNTYKFTDCGAWCATAHDDQSEVIGVKVGSIVEGSDAETDVHTIKFPFKMKEFWAALDEVESEAEMLWNEANGDTEMEES